MKDVNLKFWGLPAIAVWVALSSGCASLGKQQDLPPEEAVRLRAQAWADALLAGDFGGAYALTSPNYRQFASVQRYSRSVLGTSQWTSAAVESVQCDESVCDARIRIDYSIKRMKISNSRLVDYKWVKAEGEWWLYVPAN